MNILGTDYPLTQEQLKALLHYDPETGIFTWIQRRGSASAGSNAGTLNNGYLRIKVNKHFEYAHRLAFLFMEGGIPPEQVDHINHDRTDNRWANLRKASLAENNRNRPLRSTNTSGATGVTRNGRNWMAQVVYNGRHHYCGTYTCKSEAAEAARRKRAELHQDFAQGGNTQCS